MKKLIIVGITVLHSCTFGISAFGQAAKAKTITKPKTGTGNDKLLTSNAKIVPANVPEQLKNTCLQRGSSSALRYYNNITYKSYASREVMQEYKVDALGNVEYVQALSLHFDGDCSNMTFSYFKGNMIFDTVNQKVEWIPTSATFRKRFCTGPAEDRKGKPEDLVRSKATYYYKFHHEYADMNYLMLYTDTAKTEWVGSYRITRCDSKKE